MTTKSIGFHHLLEALKHRKDFSPAAFTLLCEAYGQHMADKKNPPAPPRKGKSIRPRRRRNPNLEPAYRKLMASRGSRN